MLLKDIATNSQYLTDETISDTILVPMINSAIAHINTETRCNLPFAVAANVNTTSYDAVSDSWQLRLLEPYLCFSIFSNDTSSSDVQYHYNRFLEALRVFKKQGLKDIKTTDSEGNDTGYAGRSSKAFPIDVTDRTVDGWF